MFVSHQGVGVCCVNLDKHRGVMPSEFWRGQVRNTALSRMEQGQTVKGCHNCYKTEEKKMPSSRSFAKSYDTIPSKELPTMLDLDFSNFCNLKCVMCDAVRSSEWAKDLGEPVSTVSTELLDDLVSISDNVVHLTIQGGEPTIMREYEYYFTALEKRGLISQIDLQMITNATNVNKRFYDLLGKFKKVRLSISIDAYGKANDYIRWPSNFAQIEKNLIKMSELPINVEVEILNSLNMLSMFNYYDFLKWCKKIENIYADKNKVFKVIPMKVFKPPMYSPFCATPDLKNKFVMDVKQFMQEDNLKHNSNWKTEMLLVCKQIEKTEVDEQAIKSLKDTVDDLDIKRNKSIDDYIPEFSTFIK